MDATVDRQPDRNRRDHGRPHIDDTAAPGGPPQHHEHRQHAGQQRRDRFDRPPDRHRQQERDGDHRCHQASPLILNKRTDQPRHQDVVTADDPATPVQLGAVRDEGLGQSVYLRCEPQFIFAGPRLVAPQHYPQPSTAPRVVGFGVVIDRRFSNQRLVERR